MRTVCIVRHQWAKPISGTGVSPQFDSVFSELYLSRVLSRTGKRTILFYTFAPPPSIPDIALAPHGEVHQLITLRLIGACQTMSMSYVVIIHVKWCSLGWNRIYNFNTTLITPSFLRSFSMYLPHLQLIFHLCWGWKSDSNVYWIRRLQN